MTKNSPQIVMRFSEGIPVGQHIFEVFSWANGWWPRNFYDAALLESPNFVADCCEWLATPTTPVSVVVKTIIRDVGVENVAAIDFSSREQIIRELTAIKGTLAA